jgi:hypothetical protein
MPDGERCLSERAENPVGLCCVLANDADHIGERDLLADDPAYGHLATNLTVLRAQVVATRRPREAMGRARCPTR